MAVEISRHNPRVRIQGPNSALCHTNNLISTSRDKLPQVDQMKFQSSLCFIHNHVNGASQGRLKAD